MADNIRLKVDVAGGPAARAELRGIGNAVDSTARQSTRAGSSIGSGLKAGVAAGAFAAVAAIGLVGHALADSVGEARESQRVTAQTNAVLKSTGGAANIGAKGVGNLAGQLSRKAGIDDELIQSGENVLLTFTNVRNEVGRGNRIFDRATRTAVDMSTALGTDLKGANIQLGKALNDPIKGISALSRVGVSFTAQQKEQIKGYVESGDKLKAQKVILGELSKEFGGSAEAQATAGGKFKVAVGNIKESIGTALLPALDGAAKAFTPLLEQIGPKLGPAITKVIGFVHDFAGAWLDGAGGVDGAKQALADAKPFLDRIGDGVKLLAAGAIKYAPVLGAQFRVTAKVFGFVGNAITLVYNNALVPFLRYAIGGMGRLTIATGRVVQGLGFISGNKGLQKTGADMVETGRKAVDLATKIKKIPDRKPKVQPVIGSTNAIENRLNTLTRDRHVRVILDNPSVNKPRVSTTGGGGQTGAGRYAETTVYAAPTTVQHVHQVSIKVEAPVGNRAQIGAEVADYLDEYYALVGV